MNDWSLHDVLDTSWLFFQTAFSTHRYPLRRLPFYILQEIGSSVSIPVSASWNIRERNISWARRDCCVHRLPASLLT